MDARDRARDAIVVAAATRVADDVDARGAQVASLETPQTMVELFEALKAIVPPDCHDKCAHLLRSARCIVKTGRDDEKEVLRCADNFAKRVMQ